MTCDAARHWLTAYLDGELELTGALDLERHLEDCPACAAALAAQRALSDAIGDADLRYRPTPMQRERLRRALRRGAAEPAPASGSVGGSGSSGSGPLGHRLRSLAALLAVAVAAWSLGRFGPGPGGSSLPPGHDGVGDEVVASHVRSLLAGHPEDVISTDRHTVKPWFEGKLDYAPEVVDLAVDGFPLAGGRLDYLDGRPVAALVYRSDRHVINLFTWPATGDRAAPVLSASTRRGFHVVHWTAGGMTYWAVSDLAAGKLEGFARHLAAGLGTG